MAADAEPSTYCDDGARISVRYSVRRAEVHGKSETFQAERGPHLVQRRPSGVQSGNDV